MRNDGQQGEERARARSSKAPSWLVTLASGAVLIGCAGSPPERDTVDANADADGIEELTTKLICAPCSIRECELVLGRPVCTCSPGCEEGTHCAGTKCVTNCVSSACGACGACDIAGCAARAKDSIPQTSCGAYLCDGASLSCPTTCAADADCVSGNYCGTGQCLPRQGNGTACGFGDQCASGFCTDGVCCTSSSCGPCGVCNVSGGGTCTPLAHDASPSTPCTPYLCDGTNTSCPSTCVADADCQQPSYFCNGTTCAPKVAQAGKCTANNQCGSGFCVDGVCCDRACGSTCEACDINPGTCTTIGKDAIPHGSRAPCASTPTTCSSHCDGVNAACQYPSSTTNCGSVSCFAGQQTLPGLCSGSGACMQPPQQPCNGYTCGGTTCRTSCTPATQGTDCIAGYFCSGTTCTSAAGLGSSCTSSAQCSAGNFCTDGVCCGVASCGTGSSCDYNGGTAGVCHKLNGTACTANGECGSNFCVDGVCCTSACTGLCQSCNNALGNCNTLASGSAPLPAHGSCGGTATSPQCAQLCNGSDATACHYPGGGVTCGAGSCKSSIETLAGACDGSGNCAQSSISCNGYACSGTTCRSSCSSDVECDASSFCSAGHCIPKFANGATCAGGNACGSNHCTNGVCCSSSACGTCGTCNGGTPGTCTPVARDLTPSSSCGAYLCSGTDTGCATSCVSDVDCVSGDYCSATGKCAPRRSLGVACAIADECTSGNCTTGVCCSAAGCGPCGTCDGSSPGSCTAVAKNTAPTASCGGYLCDGSHTVCATACTVDANCVSTDFCNGGQCLPKLPNSSACSASSVCQSGFCTNNVCCDVATCGAGSACNVSGSAGSCTKVNGTACTVGSDCGSGFCVDKVCCNSSCTGECQACDIAGNVGICSVNPPGSAPHGTRPKCSGTGVGTTCGPTCDGSDPTTCHAASTSKLCGTASCSVGIATPVGACDGSGSCQQTGTPCNGYACNTTSCRTVCDPTASVSQCDSGFFCKGKACVPADGLGNACTADSQCSTGFCTEGVCCGVRSCGTGETCSGGARPGVCSKSKGSACTVDAQCGSGFCVDGVCCESRCAAQCQACDVSGAVGSCTTLPTGAAPHGSHGACTGPGAGTTCGPSCNGVDATKCSPAATSVSCGSPSCAAGIAKAVGVCDGAGTCHQTSATCNGFACDTTACRSICNASTDCEPGYFCTGNKCQAATGLGSTCTSNTQCSTGFCTDGVCCGVASCGTGGTCNSPANAGSCRTVNGSACTGGADCASGHCTDGVCCDQACSGQCQACDVGGSVGTCTPVVGPPHLARTACDALAANDCARAQCDGKDVTKCSGYANGGTVVCKPGSCIGDQAVVSAKCDGSGSCASNVPSSCVPFTCRDSACLKACTGAADCAAGYTCDVTTGRCTEGATCSSDKLSTLDKSGNPTSCAPFICGSDGKCMQGCASTADCVPGDVCDTSTVPGNCLAAPTTSSGGCAVRTPAGEGGGGAVAALVMAALVVARRRVLRGGATAVR